MMMEEKETQAKKKKRKSKAWHKCCVCLATSAIFPKRKFFRFPSDLDRCKEWVKSLKQPELSSQLFGGLYKKYRVCSIHFNDKAYASSIRKYLSKNAVPINTTLNVAEMSETLRQKLQPAISNDMSLKCSLSKDNDVISSNDVSNVASESKGESSSTSQSEQAELNPESSPVASEPNMAVQKNSANSIIPDLSEELPETGSSSFVKQEVPMDMHPAIAMKIKQEPKERLDIGSANTEEVNHSVQAYPTLSRNETLTHEIFLLTNGRLSTSHEGLSATHENFPMAYKVVPDVPGMLPSTHDTFPIVLLTERHPFPATLEKFSTVRKMLPMGPFAIEIKQKPENASAILSTNVEEANYSVPESSALCRSENLVSAMPYERSSKTCDSFPANEINPQSSAILIKEEPEDPSDFCFSKAEGVNHGIEESSENLPREGFSWTCNRFPKNDISPQPLDIEIKQEPDNSQDILLVNVKEANQCVQESPVLFRTKNQMLELAQEPESKSRIGSLFQPPVLIMDELVTEEEL